MTEAVAIPPDTSAIVQRRLVGLAVLLIAAFVLSLLLRARAPSPDALPSVVIPLGSSASTSGPAPLLDAPEPEAEAAPTLGEAPRPVPQAPALAPKPTVAKPVAKPIEKPATEKPAPPKPKLSAPKPTVTLADKPKPVAAPAKPNPASKPAVVVDKPEKPAATARWFVAVGAYKDPMAAQAIAARIKMAGFGAGSSAITSAGERLHRVRAGPFASKTDAESARATLIVEGLTKATVISEK